MNSSYAILFLIRTTFIHDWVLIYNDTLGNFLTITVLFILLQSLALTV